MIERNCNSKKYLIQNYAYSLGVLQGSSLCPGLFNCLTDVNDIKGNFVIVIHTYRV